MKTIIEVGNVLLEVQRTSSKKEKESIIASYNDNTLFTKVLNHIFNPFVKTNIAKKKLTKIITAEVDSEQLSSVEEYMEYLSKSTGKDSHIVVVQAYIASQPEEIRWLLEAMATKDLKIGATSSTINKAYGHNLIPTFDLMLAEKYVETKKAKGVSRVVENWKRYIGKRVIATKKLDGNRIAVFVRHDGSIKFYSREGHELIGCIELEEAFSHFPAGFVYDGEILATNPEGLNSQLLFKKTSKIVKKNGEKKDLEFHAFDLLPIEAFENGGFAIDCEIRKESLNKTIAKVNQPLVKYVEPLYIGEFDYDKMEQFADEAKVREEEGIMVQLAKSPYECKRTFGILKVKSFESADIRCLDVYEGKKDSTKGKLGGLVLDFKGYRVNIGGGFSAEQREDLWKNPELVIGKIVEIKYFEEFEDENGDLDLRFATFKTIREDKSEPSYY